MTKKKLTLKGKKIIARKIANMTEKDAELELSRLSSEDAKEVRERMLNIKKENKKRGLIKTDFKKKAVGPIRRKLSSAINTENKVVERKGIVINIKKITDAKEGSRVKTKKGVVVSKHVVISEIGIKIFISEIDKEGKTAIGDVAIVGIPANHSENKLEGVFQIEAIKREWPKIKSKQDEFSLMLVYKGVMNGNKKFYADINNKRTEPTEGSVHFSSTYQGDFLTLSPF